MRILNKINLSVFAAVVFSGISFGQGQEDKLERLQEIYKEKTAIVNQRQNTVSDGLKSKAQAGTEMAFTGAAGSPSEAETYIEVNPNNSNNIVASFMNSVNTLEFPIYYSNDAGLSWTKSNFNVRNQFMLDFPGGVIAGGGDPVFTFDDNGNCYFSWIYLRLNAGNFDTAWMDMFWAKSADGGQTWTVNADHRIGGGAFLLSGGGISGIAEVNNGILDRQWMATDRSGGVHDGNIYVTSYFISHPTSSFPNDGMVVSRLRPSDASFQLTSYAGQGSTQFGNVVVNQANGNVHVTYCDLGTNRLYHSVSTDGGSNFSVPNIVATANRLFPTVTNRVHSRENAAANLDIDGGGNLHLVWTDYEPGNYTSYYSASYNNGITWSSPMMLDSLLANEKAFMPTVAADGNGVSISFYAVDNTKKSSYKVANSFDGGLTFQSPQTVSGGITNFQSANNAFYGDYNRSSRAGCDLYTTWSDGRSGSPVAYVGKIDACAGIGIQEYSPINASVKVGEVYPQPALKSVKINVTAKTAGNMEIVVMDVSGAIVMKNTDVIKAGKNALSINIGTLGKGSYILFLKNDQGLEFSRKLMIQ